MVIEDHSWPGSDLSGGGQGHGKDQGQYQVLGQGQVRGYVMVTENNSRSGSNWLGWDGSGPR